MNPPSNAPLFNFTSQTQYDDSVCNPDRMNIRNMPPYYNITETDSVGDGGGISAVLINGVLMFDSSSA